MQTVSTAWTTLATAFQAGIGAEVTLGILVPARGVLLTSRPWDAAWIPAGTLVYPYLAPFGQGLGALQVELADDRSSRVGNVSCQLHIAVGQMGLPMTQMQQLLLSLSEQGALVLGVFLGGTNHDALDIRTLFAGRLTVPRLSLGQLALTLVDGAALDHRPIAITVGTDLFPGAPLEAHGLAAPLVIGGALGLQPILVGGMATGTLATPLSATETGALNVAEIGATFGLSGSIVVESETLTYDGRRVTLLPEGITVLQLLTLSRAAPVAHAAGVVVQSAPPVQYRYLVGIGLPRLELLAVRDQEGPIATFDFQTDIAGLPAGTAMLVLGEAHEGVEVDVQVEAVPPPAPLVNGGFESGDLTGWSTLPGSTAAVSPATDAVSGQYLMRLSGLSDAQTGISQDLAVETGARYTLLLYWRALVPQDDNLLDNGDFTDPDDSQWTPETDGMPEDIDDTYNPGDATGPVTVNGSQTFTLPPEPLMTTGPDGGIIAAGYRSFSVWLEQEVTLEAGLPLSVDVRVDAWLEPITNELHHVGFSGGGGPAPAPMVYLPACEVSVSVTFRLSSTTSLAWQGYLTPDQPASTPGRLAHFAFNGPHTFTPTSAGTYAFRVEVFGRYLGQVPPIVVNSVVVIPTPPAALSRIVSATPLAAADAAPLQAVGVVQLGTPADPALYTTRILQGPTGWQRQIITVVATAPTLRVSLLAETTTPGTVFDYDGLRFLPAGRNPVRVMAEVFARFLPHLTLDSASVETAATLRDGWLFSGWIPDPGRTDTLLTKMSQECFCTLYKDVQGVYKIVADEPRTAPAMTLESTQDLFQGTTAHQWLSGDLVYTDFYVWYQRVSTQVTTSQAGQYAAVLYVTPDMSISQDVALKYLCIGAANQLGSRRRFDYYADFIADPDTADMLLGRLVYQLTTLPTEIVTQAALPALPLEVTDRVQLYSPLLDGGAFAGDVRAVSLTPSPTPPGLAVGLTLRSVPGAPARRVVETWDYFGAHSFMGQPNVPTALRVRETWEEEGPGPEPPFTDGVWFWSSATSGAVTAGYMRVNAEPPSSASAMRIHELSSQTGSQREALLRLQGLDTLTIYDGLGGIALRYRLMSSGTDLGAGEWTLPIILLEMGSGLLVNNEESVVRFTYYSEESLV